MIPSKTWVVGDRMCPAGKRLHPPGSHAPIPVAVLSDCGPTVNRQLPISETYQTGCKCENLATPHFSHHSPPIPPYSLALYAFKRIHVHNYGPVNCGPKWPKPLPANSPASPGFPIAAKLNAKQGR